MVEADILVMCIAAYRNPSFCMSEFIIFWRWAWNSHEGKFFICALL